MPNRDLNNMRESYESSFLLEDCEKNPFKQFDKWFQLAVLDKLIEPSAIQIATVGKDLRPSLSDRFIKKR